MSSTTEHVRQTIADRVFNSLYEDILSHKLRPGEKLSEVDIAHQLAVSRQPVREAFIRLGNLELLTIRPQRATIVSRLSRNKIVSARFIRCAIEVDVARVACQQPPEHPVDELQANLRAQGEAVFARDVARFDQLDRAFHRLHCEFAGLESVYPTVSSCKTGVDRLCSLSMTQADELDAILEDHQELLYYLERRNGPAMQDAMRRHLARIDATIDMLAEECRGYFED